MTIDRVTAGLTERGVVVTKMSLGRDGVSGYHIRFGDSEIVYRVDDDGQTLIIPLYRDNGPVGGLRDSFRDLIGFLKFLRENPSFGIVRVRGLIRAERQGASTRLPTARITEFYKRLLGAKTWRWELGEEWLSIDLCDVCTPKERRNRMPN